MMKIKCDLCGGELLMDAGGQTASCINCGMKHSVERVREMLAGTSGQSTEITPEEPQDNDSDAEWEPLDADPLQEEEDAEWEPVLDPDESYYTRYLRFNAQLYPKSDKDSWEKIEWDIFSSNNCEFFIEFREDALANRFPAEYARYQREYANAQKPSEQMAAIGRLGRLTSFDVTLTPEQLEKLDQLLEAFTNCEADVINPMEPVWEMELNYPNHDVKHQIRGDINDGTEVLMELATFLLEIFHRNFKERYPGITWHE